MRESTSREMELLLCSSGLPPSGMVVVAGLLLGSLAWMSSRRLVD